MQLLQNIGVSSSSSSNQVISDITEGAMQSEGTSFSFALFAANAYRSASKLKNHFSWIIDFGATDHICSNQSLFSSLQPLSQSH